MYKILAKTLFVGQHLIYVPECHSTNDLAAQKAREQAPEGTIVITEHQTGGRGQRGATWTSEPGKNLTISLILRPTFLDPAKQFKLSMAVAIGVMKTVQAFAPGKVSIKWPNDILIDGEKVAGILIENQLQSGQLAVAVVGIGLNVNQHGFGVVPNATSLSLCAGRPAIPLDEVLSTLAANLEAMYLQLRGQQDENISAVYHDALYRRGEHVAFRLANGDVFSAVIDRVNERGHLVLLRDGMEQSFDIKEVVFEDR